MLCNTPSIHELTYIAHISPTHNGNTALQHFKRDNVIEICNETTFDFYPGLPHMQTSEHSNTHYMEISLSHPTNKCISLYSTISHIPIFVIHINMVLQMKWQPPIHNITHSPCATTSTTHPALPQPSTCKTISLCTQVADKRAWLAKQCKMYRNGVKYCSVFEGSIPE